MNISLKVYDDPLVYFESNNESFSEKINSTVLNLAGETVKVDDNITKGL